MLEFHSLKHSIIRTHTDLYLAHLTYPYICWWTGVAYTFWLFLFLRYIWNYHNSKSHSDLDVHFSSIFYLFIFLAVGIIFVFWILTPYYIYDLPSSIYWVNLYITYCYDKTLWPSATWRGKGLFSLTCSNHRPSWREGRAETQGRNLVAKTEVEAIKEHCLLACCLWLDQTAFLKSLFIYLFIYF